MSDQIKKLLSQELPRNERQQMAQHVLAVVEAARQRLEGALAQLPEAVSEPTPQVEAPVAAPTHANPLWPQAAPSAETALSSELTDQAAMAAQARQAIIEQTALSGDIANRSDYELAG